MTNFKHLKNKSEGQQKDELLSTLFQHASARPKAPLDDEAAIRAAVFTQWQKITGQRKQKRYLTAFGLAASLVVAVILINNLQEQPQPVGKPQQLAHIEIRRGDVFVHNVQDKNSAAHRLANNTLYAGQVISTGTGSRLALEWNSGESIRIDENSEVALKSTSEIELIAGRVYVDSQHSTQTGATFMIRTVAGLIQHLGTQYLAATKNETVTLAVREGRVSLDGGTAEVTIQKGELAHIDTTGITQVTSIKTFDQMWQWTTLVTPELSLDGLSAFDFVQWAGRETGREVQFSDAATRKLSVQTRLRGSVNLAPDRALDLILLTSDLEAMTSNDKILIRKRTGT